MGDLGGWLPAIRQIYTYCITANARYGFLITDQELLAIRISWLESAGKTLPKTTREEEVKRRQRKGNLEYKAIPWTNDGSDSSSSTHGLTINLALWWLHMMAAIGHEIEDYDHALVKADPRNSSDEDEARDRFGDSEEREAQTPPSNKRQCSFELKHGQSFRSETSDVRHILSATALDRDDRQTSPTIAAASERKRRREAPDLDRGHSRARRRVNPARGGKR